MGSRNIRDLRQLVSNARVEHGIADDKNLIPIHYGRKKTLKPLAAPQIAADRRDLKTPARGFRLDNLLKNIDATYVGDWLRRANDLVQDLQQWWSADNHAMEFTHYWLSEFPDEQRNRLLIMEYQLLQEELKLAFTVALKDGQVSEKDVSKLIRAVLREYPGMFQEEDGTNFIDLLCLIAAGKAEPYRKLLSAVKCDTSNEQFNQWLLSIRAFCLVTLVTAITTFYRKLCTDAEEHDEVRPGTARGSRPVTLQAGPTTRVTQQSNESPVLQDRPITASGRRPKTASRSPYGMRPGNVRPAATAVPSSTARPQTAAGARTANPATDDAFRAARLGHADVLYYMLSRGMVPLDSTDGLGRTLLFVAVLHNSLEVVDLLLDNRDLFEINTPAGSGNTPVHAAATNGNLEALRALLSAGADPSVPNSQNGILAVNVAEMFGHDDCVALLNSFQ